MKQITNKELIEYLVGFPPEAKIYREVSGFRLIKVETLPDAAEISDEEDSFEITEDKTKVNGIVFD